MTICCVSFIYFHSPCKLSISSLIASTKIFISSFVISVDFVLKHGIFIISYFSERGLIFLIFSAKVSKASGLNPFRGVKLYLFIHTPLVYIVRRDISLELVLTLKLNDIDPGTNLLICFFSLEISSSSLNRYFAGSSHCAINSSFVIAFIFSFSSSSLVGGGMYSGILLWASRLYRVKNHSD